MSIWVAATDDVGVATRNLTVNGTPVALDAGGLAVYTVQGAPGAVLALVGTATDAAGNVSSPAIGQLRIRDPNDQAPTVALKLGKPSPFRDGDRIVFTLPDGSKQGFTFVGRPLNPDAPFADPQAQTANSDHVPLVSSTYDSYGEVTSTASTTKTDPATGQTSIRTTFSVYDGADRVAETWQVKDVVLAIVATTVGTATVYRSELRIGSDTFTPQAQATGQQLFAALKDFFQVHDVVVSSTATQYDNSGRVVSSFDQYGNETRTSYNATGDVIQTASQSKDENGDSVWVVSRTAYDAYGRVELATDRFMGQASSPDTI
ncbi:MAG: hypothetical protein NTY19_37340, partial [Planctomycetota bacterium]|nr:hypothetical protein [Planctomycetota bacterium]